MRSAVQLALADLLAMAICRNLCVKRQMSVSEPHFGEVRGDHDLGSSWLTARRKAHGQLPIRVN